MPVGLSTRDSKILFWAAFKRKKAKEREWGKEEWRESVWFYFTAPLVPSDQRRNGATSHTGNATQWDGAVRSSTEIARKEDGLWGMVIAVVAAVERGATAALAEDAVVAGGTVEEDSRLRPEAALLFGLWITSCGRHPDDVRAEVAGGQFQRFGGCFRPRRSQDSYSQQPLQWPCVCVRLQKDRMFVFPIWKSEYEDF